MYKIFIFILLSLIACNRDADRKNPETEKELKTKNSAGSAGSALDIKTGSLKSAQMYTEIELTGIIKTYPSGQAFVTTPYGGYIREIYILPSSNVKKGDIIALLEHPDFIKIQQEYLETKNRLDYFEKDYSRQGELALEDAVSVKKMQEVRSEYLSLEARLSSLKAQLKLLNLDAESIKVDQIKSAIPVYSPISGSITKINGHIGKFVEPGGYIAEILNQKDIYLELFIYESEAIKIKPGQQVKFRLNCNPEQEYNARIKAIAGYIDEDTRAVKVLAQINITAPCMKPGMYVNATVQSNPDSVFVLSDNAIITTGDKQFIFLKSDTSFEKQPVTTGRNLNGFVEILNYSNLEGKDNIVVEGAYYVNAAFENSSE